MKYFPTHRIADALAHAAAGGQSLHVPKAPRVFRRSGTFAHLFDQDRGRLEATARRLGVRFVSVHNAGLPGQHVDLVGRPLGRAQRLCEADGQEPSMMQSIRRPLWPVRLHATITVLVQADTAAAARKQAELILADADGKRDAKAALAGHPERIEEITVAEK